MNWTEHAIWWQAYPLGFTGAPIREPDDDPQPHRLRRLVPWLDHIVDLGANGLLLGPIFASATHGYDTVDHFRIDPRLGTDDDLDALVSAAHDRGIRVCLDGVFNHVSDQHPYLLDALANGPESRYARWFDIDWGADGGPVARCFEGHRQLVELRHEEPEVRDYVRRVLGHWGARGVDAWRLDAAYAVDPAFWAQVLPAHRSSYPDARFIAEMIHGDYPGYARASTVESVTQYELWKAIWSALNDRNFFELDWALQRHNDFVAELVPQTFVGNHDVTRIATRVGAELAAIALVVLMTIGGMPSIYAGDELGYTGVKEDREGGDDAVRPEFPAEPPVGDRGATFRLHQDLIGIRRRHSWLHKASTTAAELTNTRYRYTVTSADRAHSLTVDIDLDAGPRATISADDGAVLLVVDPA